VLKISFLYVLLKGTVLMTPESTGNVILKIKRLGTNQREATWFLPQRTLLPTYTVSVGYE
jgi:hypothetical protein